MFPNSYRTSSICYTMYVYTYMRRRFLKLFLHRWQVCTWTRENFRNFLIEEKRNTTKGACYLFKSFRANELYPFREESNGRTIATTCTYFIKKESFSRVAIISLKVFRLPVLIIDSKKKNRKERRKNRGQKKEKESFYIVVDYTKTHKLEELELSKYW